MDEITRLNMLDQYRESENLWLSLISIPEHFETDEIQMKTDFSSSSLKYNKMHRVGQYDRLERIANKYGCSREDIITRNNLTYPFIDTTQTKSNAKKNGTYDQSVKYVEEYLLIPSANPMDIPKINLINIPDNEKNLGSDFLLKRDENEEFDFVENMNGNDVEIISGKAAVKQALLIKLETRQYRLIDFPFYGRPIQPGRIMNEFEIAFDRFNLRSAVLTDSRISDALITLIKGVGGKWVYHFVANVRGIAGQNNIEGVTP